MCKRPTPLNVQYSVPTTQLQAENGSVDMSVIMTADAYLKDEAESAASVPKKETHVCILMCVPLSVLLAMQDVQGLPESIFAEIECERASGLHREKTLR